MSTTKVEHLQTTLFGDEKNPYVVTYDLTITEEIAASAHEDNPCPEREETREVTITAVEIILFDKYGIDVTGQFIGAGSSSNLRERLKDALLEEIEYISIHDLKAAA
ncbi:MAG: hypothetical protein V4615_05050 [Bacteroidota bacterium]